MKRTPPTTAPHQNNIASPRWGLQCDIAPCFGTRRVQEGNRLHFLADRAGFSGAFSQDEARQLDQAFPLMLKQLELLLLSGELDPRRQHSVMLNHNGLTCNADTLGSHGYVYIAMYPTPPSAA